MIDSGASACVSSMCWLEGLVGEERPVKVQVSDKIFRFGDGKCQQGRGFVVIDILMGSCNGSGRISTRIRIDVIDGKLPLLIPYKCSSEWKCIIDFPSNTLWSTGPYFLYSLPFVVVFFYIKHQFACGFIITMVNIMKRLRVFS